MWGGSVCFTQQRYSEYQYTLFPAEKIASICNSVIRRHSLLPPKKTWTLSHRDPVPGEQYFKTSKGFPRKTVPLQLLTSAFLITTNKDCQCYHPVVRGYQERKLSKKNNRTLQLKYGACWAHYFKSSTIYCSAKSGTTWTFDICFPLRRRLPKF